jgi:hypothetical protein
VPLDGPRAQLEAGHQVMIKIFRNYEKNDEVFNSFDFQKFKNLSHVLDNFFCCQSSPNQLPIS